MLFIRREVKHLLPATILKLKSIRPHEWTAAIHDKLCSFVQSMSTIQAKISFLSDCCHFFIDLLERRTLSRSYTSMAFIWNDIL